MPEAVLYFGRSPGAAQPLVWCHSEYVKLLRSVADGKVFDRISVVEERYAAPVAERKSYNKVESFELTWPTDGWQPTQKVMARDVGLAGFDAQIPKEATEKAQAVSFTIFWPA